MKASNFISGMTAGLIVGSAASVLVVSSMNGKIGRQFKQTANRAVRTVGDTITNTMQD